LTFSLRISILGANFSSKDDGKKKVKLKFVWPGKTKNRELRLLQDDYLRRIGRLAGWELAETREARGLSERFPDKILDVEAQGLEKQLANDYIICLSDGGTEMTSTELAGLLGRACRETSGTITFVVGGFLGLAERILRRARVRLSLSRMTLSHELCRVVLLEQVYRSLTLMKGKRYAK
jgi:23S rRNA (pseudouridine1915-N3)-methyltransferase